MSKASTTYDSIRTGKANTSNTQPVIVVNPAGNIHFIALSNENKGYVIDANTPTEIYAVTIESNVSVGNSWKVWVVASSFLAFVNNTTKTLQTAGTVYIPDSYIYISGELVPGAVSPQPSNSATYEITITEVTETTVRAVVNVVFAPLQLQSL